jgi:hypothetical protein
MSKQRTKIVKELDPQELEGYSKAHIEHYLSLGYRPYLNEHGHIKWLTQAQMSLRGTAGGGGISLRNLLRFKRSVHYKSRRRRRTHWLSFIKANWFFLSLVVLTLIGAFYLLHNAHILF